MLFIYSIHLGIFATVRVQHSTTHSRHIVIHSNSNLNKENNKFIYVLSWVSALKSVQS